MNFAVQNIKKNSPKYIGTRPKHIGSVQNQKWISKMHRLT